VVDAVNYYAVCMGRDLATPTRFPRGVFAVDSFGFEAMLGSKAASIVVTNSDEESLKRLFLYLGMGIEIHDELGRWVWGGIIYTVKVKLGAVEEGLSLEQMANSVKTTYSHGSAAATTDALTDADSISKYETKEFVESMKKIATAPEAEQRRAILLDQYKYPLPIQVQIGQDDGTNSATLECIGYGQTLSWKKYTRAQALLSNTANTESGSFKWMENRAVIDKWQMFPFVTKIAQKITIGAEGFWAGSFEFYAGGVLASNTSNVRVVLRADSANPELGTVLATSDWKRFGTADFQEFVLSPSYYLTPNTSYWVILENDILNRDGYYVIGVDPALAGANVSKCYTDDATYGAAWYPITIMWEVVNSGGAVTDFQWLWKINGLIENGLQIAAIVTNVNQFIAGTDVQVSSGQVTTPTQDGTRTALEIITELLNNGTTNKRRLLARVTRDRILTIYEEPALPTKREYVPLRLTRKGRLVDRFGHPVVSDPCGQWCLSDAFGFPDELVVNPGLHLIESAEWRQGQWTPNWRGAIDPIRAILYTGSKT
jgi:hypothetical protein